MSASLPQTPWEACSRPGLLLGSWPWRSAAHLLSSALLAAPFTASALFAGVEAVHGRGVPLLAAVVLFAAAGPLLAVPLARWERRRLRLVDLRPIRSGHRVPRNAGLWRRMRTRYGEAATWRELGYLGLLAVAAPVGVAVPLLVLLWALAALVGPVMVLSGEAPVTLLAIDVETLPESFAHALGAVAALSALPYLVSFLAGLHVRVARVLLGEGPDGRLRDELVEVARSRARLVDAFEAERRRIERDLHDGAQQSLLGLTLQLGLARLDLPPDSPAAERVAAAHRQAKELMAELRELVEGIHPRVLTDRGLPGALGELADRSPLRVEVDAALPGRPPASVEATAYFVAAEALTNAAKHGGGTQAAVRAWWRDGLLTVEVEDDGHGGADPTAGTGLTGLADRVAVIDGRMLLASPSGGPTTLRVEFPCTLEHPLSE
ncbi:sensor histidine kinase [Actinocorallia populi]|uniref:sensor histidine kinase n=1 Tax=Actinocorallia populi TaxID=2079200 RepID=UPI000D090D52|nr:sensor domain-containing protein [Actinocorallia populi]